jgi:hypothetical protein
MEAVTCTTLDSWLTSVLEEARRESESMPIPEMTERLRRLLGQQIASHIVEGANPKPEDDWRRGEWMPPSSSEQRLRAAFQIVQLIAMADSEDTARAWFVGMNPHFANRAPFAILGESRSKLPEVLEAAKAFLVNG